MATGRPAGDWGDPALTHWTSDNLDTSHFTDAGHPPVPHGRCRHGLIAAVCRLCDWPEMAAPQTDDEPWGVPLDDPEQSGAWLGAVLLAVAFALGLALGWMIGGIR